MDPISVLIGVGVGSALTVAGLRKRQASSVSDLHHPAYLVVERRCEAFVYVSEAERGSEFLEKVMLPPGMYPLTEAADPDGLSAPWLVTTYKGRRVGRQGDAWRDIAVEADNGFFFQWAR